MPTSLSDHYIVIGHGRVGSVIEEALRTGNSPTLVIEDRAAVPNLVGVEVIKGNAADPDVLIAANPAAARCIFVAVPDAFEAGPIVEQARAANPSVPIIARAHSEAEHQHLTRLGATHTVLGERELRHGRCCGRPGLLASRATRRPQRLDLRHQPVLALARTAAGFHERSASGRNGRAIPAS